MRVVLGAAAQFERDPIPSISRRNFGTRVDQAGALKDLRASTLCQTKDSNKGVECQRPGGLSLRSVRRRRPGRTSFKVLPIYALTLTVYQTSPIRDSFSKLGIFIPKLHRQRKGTIDIVLLDRHARRISVGQPCENGNDLVRPGNVLPLC